MMASDAAPVNLVEKEQTISEKVDQAIDRASRILAHAESMHSNTLGDAEPTEDRIYGQYMLDRLNRLCWTLEMATVLLQRLDGQLFDQSRPEPPCDPA